MNRRHGGHFAALVVMLLATAHAWAAQPYQEYRKHIETAQTITALSDDLMGDSVRLYNGATEFTATDIDIPGNNALPVRLGRRFSIEITPGGSPGSSAGDPAYRGIGNWDIEVPYLTTTYGNGAWESTRCSAPVTPSVPAPLHTTDVWQGNTVHLPGDGDRKLLRLVSAEIPRPTDGVARKWTTRERDMVSCIPMQGDSGLAGEGFLLQTTDGTRYYFDRATTRYAGYMTYQAGEGGPSGTVGRTKYYLLASRVVDRFGNEVTYTYNASGHPTQIASSDGRTITLTYTSGRLSSATAYGRTWTYGYGAGAETGMLTSVIRPDGSQWTYTNTGNLFPDDGGIWDGTSSANCGIQPPAVPASFTLKVTHPSGAVGTFNFANLRQPRPGVHMNACAQRINNGIVSYKLLIPTYFDVMVLKDKTITGMGLSSRTWTYTYPQGRAGLWGSRGDGQPYPCSTCGLDKTVIVDEPDGTSTQYRYGALYAANEGRLLGKTVLDAAGVAVRTESTEYLPDAVAAGQTFHETYGTGFGTDEPSSLAVRPVVRQTVDQDGVQFLMAVATCGTGLYCFDAYGNPTRATRSSTLGYSRTDTTEYHNDTARWLVGLAKRRLTNGIEAERIDYDTLSRPWKSYAYGLLQQTLTYNADGTVATVSDGRDGVNGMETTVTLSSWKRGTPQSIRHPATPESPTGATQSAEVNDDGTLATITDENGYTTCYDYDAMRRLSKITYPSETQPGVCDESKSAPTTIAFTSGHGAAYGMPAGHWRRTTLTGNGRHVIVYDALWRPVVEQSLDLGNPSATTSEVIKRYDAGGRLAFQSYPMNTNGQAVYTDSTLKGTHTTYDALDRATRVEQDSELGRLITTTDYLTGFQTRVTNPRGKITTTRFQVYDQPTTDWPVLITHPEGAHTHITRDVFGKPTLLRRSNSATPIGGTLALDRRYIYGGAQRLCTVTEPETGTTYYGYDSASNLVLTAAGLAIPAGTSCADAKPLAIASGRSVERTYDARNRLTSLTFPDGRGNTTHTYYPDGLPKTLVANNQPDQITTTYTYNPRRQLTRETLSWPNVLTWPVDYVYNANGHLASQNWHGLTVDYAPNALGQPTKAGTFASGVSWHPNGALRQFTYGNGIVHTLTQNVRGLPDTSRDAYGTTAYHADSLDYDHNGNVAAITDGATGRGQRGNRTMTYDGLDRLKTVVSPMYGTTGATYTYDVLDNLTRTTIGGSDARDHHYCYDASWRLTNLKTGSCTGTTVVGLGYDVQGNLQNRNGRTYEFDYGNRLRSVAADTVTGAPASTYVYDAHGRRVRDRVPTSKHSHYLHNGQLSMTSDGRRNKVAEYIYLAGSLIAIRERDTVTNVYTTKYQHTDALGSPVVVTDQNCTVLERSEYEPYGKVIAPSSPQDGPGYTGHVYDAATGLNHMQQRYYDPLIGRFLSRDPVAANAITGANFNAYWHANNNPYRFTDPDGRRACPTGTHICYEARSTKTGASQPDLSSSQKAKDANVATAQKQGRLGDGTRLNLSNAEQSFTAGEKGTSAGIDEVHGCMTCDGKKIHTMSFSLPVGSSPGHTHGEGIEQLPGRDDASRTAKTGQTAYMISKTNAFGIEHTPDGYRVRLISGPKLDRDQVRELEGKIETWNQFQGTGGGSCTPGC